jgi:hypothetical protein
MESIMLEKLNRKCVVLVTLWLIAVSLPAQNVLLNPTATQSVNQPANTTLQVNSLNGALNATLFPGGNIGAQVMSAINSLAGGCGEIYIPAGSYSQSTAITKPRCVILRGAGAQGTLLNWSASTGAAIIVGDGASATEYAEGDIEDIALNNTAASSSAIGIYFGGDPANILSPSTNYGDHQNLNRVRVAGFGTGVQWGQNAWSTSITQSIVTNNQTGLYFPILFGLGGTGNSGESISVVNTRVQNNNIGLNLIGFSDFFFFGSSCDYNVTCGTVGSAVFVGEHFEQSSGRILTIAANFQPIVSIIGGWALSQAPSGTDTDMFYVNSTLNPQVWMQGTFLHSNHPVTNIINWNGSGGASVLNIGPLPYYVSGGNLPSLTNANCAFWGCSINDGQGTFAYSSTTSAVLTNGAATFGSLSLNQTPTPSSTLSNASIPITLNGSTYYIRLSSTP